jgi:hypothetical protein
MLTRQEHVQLAKRGLLRETLTLIALALLGLVMFWALHAWVAINKVDGGDHADMVAVLDRIRDPAIFPDLPTDQPGMPGQPRLYGDPQKRQVIVLVYGVTQAADQEHLLARLRHGPVLPRAVLVRFFEREVWLTTPQGDRRHGQATLLREARLSAS